MNDLENCRISKTDLASVEVECAFRSDSTATGFEVIIQNSNRTEVSKLHVGQAINRQDRVSFEVEMDQKYQVSIFAIREGAGILDTNVEYRQIFAGISCMKCCNGCIKFSGLDSLDWSTAWTGAPLLPYIASKHGHACIHMVHACTCLCAVIIHIYSDHSRYI